MTSPQPPVSAPEERIENDDAAPLDLHAIADALRPMMAALVDPATGRWKFPFARPNGAQEIITTGAFLRMVKASLSHGEFIPWVKAECPFSYRSAHRYMCIARLFMKSDTVADLADEGSDAE